jgi:hypothetical protein
LSHCGQTTQHKRNTRNLHHFEPFIGSRTIVLLRIANFSKLTAIGQKDHTLSVLGDRKIIRAEQPVTLFLFAVREPDISTKGIKINHMKWDFDASKSDS